MLENRTQPELGGPLVFAALASAGTLLGMAAVIVGTGLHDGFSDWGLHRIIRHLRRAHLWALPLAALAGTLLYAFYARMLRPGPSGLVLLWSIARAFIHFPLYGMLALLAVVWGFAVAGWHWVRARWTRGPRPPAEASDSVLSRWLGLPLWFIILPFIAMKLPMEGDVELPETIPRYRLLTWSPALIALIFLFTDAVSEDTGDRVDPYWLAAFASFWLADYLVVALRVAPVLRARRSSDPG